MPTSEQSNQNCVQEKPLTSIWNTDPLPPSPAAPPEPSVETIEFSPEPTDDCNDDLDQSESNSQEAEPDTTETDPANFVKPKANEKKDKKSKRAEEKRRAKEAKKAAEVASGPYIPGMTGTVKPDEQIVATGNINDIREEEKLREQHEAIQRQREQMDALVKLQEDQKARLEREELIRIQQEKLAKLAPWAKKETSPVKEAGQGVTLQEIQRMEAERERKERQQREIQEARIREEQRRMEEEERARRVAKTVNWATVSAQTGGKVKSLAEIQAEEARVEKERQERENAARSVRSKDTGVPSNSSSIWGGTKTNMSWAGKIAANTPTPPQARANGGPWANANGQTAAAIVAPAGFWDPVLPDQPQQQQQQQNKKNNNKNKKKKAEEEQKVKQIFNEKKPKNDFEDWCSKALQGLQAQVDIPTFLGFLMDIESPYEVHDYVKSYVGEGKAQKKFAVDYLERRSRWKNSLKSGAKYEDDLTTPANALTPGEGEFQFQEAGKKGKKTKAPKTSKSKQDISHLLGFSVTGQGVNRGELDMPQ
jgi:PERQ amino acid-rich with GYF domain-containing protein